jgi:hypothetical protein
VSLGQGIVAKTAEKVVDAALNTPTAMSYFVGQGLEIARDKMVDEGFLQQVQCMHSFRVIGSRYSACSAQATCVVDY